MTERSVPLPDAEEPGSVLRATEAALAAHLAAVRHDLRSPVNAILGYLELLEDPRHGPLTERQRRYVANALAASRELLGEIDSTVDLCRVGTTGLLLGSEPLELGDWLEPARELAADEARRHQVGLVVTPASGPSTVLGDRGLLTRATYYLLVELVRLAAEESTISIDVIDDGPRVAIRLTTVAGPEAEVGPLAVFHATEESSALGGPIHALGFSRHVVELHGGKSRVDSSGAEWSLTFDLPREP